MGRGGMASKIGAARVAALGGVNTVVASGYDLNNITQVFAGADIGTLFPAESRPNKRQRWLTFATTTVGRIKVKNEAKRRLIEMDNEGERALLAADIMAVDGVFDKRAVVSMVDEEGSEFARGMIQMSSEDAADAMANCNLVTFRSAHAVMNPHDYVILEVL
eukprot:CAMPEP_0184307732 /NCGR_PEP_ID=MMETSP1049-20130417/16400_1 /TAXON_ID=77928 /ORGANISM="Proteomonas sulcata, Strain CCMP704" /LENGTH=161 /DNA_ID=CAMNT_0026620287 /DNA_START=127 /DNA_END=612 /DNA_ORIENTATION=-